MPGNGDEALPPPHSPTQTLQYHSDYPRLESSQSKDENLILIVSGPRDSDILDHITFCSDGSVLDIVIYLAIFLNSIH